MSHNSVSEIIMALSGLIIVLYALEKLEVSRRNWKRGSIISMVTRVTITLSWAMLALAGGGILVGPFLEPTIHVTSSPMILLTTSCATLFILDWTRKWLPKT